MKEKIKSLLFGIILFSFLVANILTPKKIFSSRENRYLENFPEMSLDSIISGKFGLNFEKYSTDQFIRRDDWISLKAISDLAMGKKDNGRIYYGKDNYLFKIDHEFDIKQLEENLKFINTLANNIIDFNQDIRITAMLVPSKSQVLKDKLPLYAPIVDEEEILRYLSLFLNKNIQVLSMLETFEEKSDEYIYYRTDHHWTSKGAFYAYEDYFGSIGETPIKAENFVITNVSNEFLGSNYRMANFYLGIPDSILSYKLKNNINLDIRINKSEKIDSLYDESFLSKTDKYSYFLGGDKALIEINNNSNNNGKSILVIKDSFGNSFIPFLTAHYEKIIVVDPRYYNSSIESLIIDKDIDQVLFLFNTKNFVQEKSIKNLTPS